jgi:hypothetical protein
MQITDVLGRRRHASQHRGLRSLFPKLAADCESRLLRVAMSKRAWEQLDRLAAQAEAATAPRAVGALLERLLGAEPARAAAEARAVAWPVESLVTTGASSADWQAWQIHKELGLLAAAQRPRSAPAVWTN